MSRLTELNNVQFAFAVPALMSSRLCVRLFKWAVLSEMQQLEKFHMENHNSRQNINVSPSFARVAVLKCRPPLVTKTIKQQITKKLHWIHGPFTKLIHKIYPYIFACVSKIRYFSLAHFVNCPYELDWNL